MHFATIARVFKAEDSTWRQDVTGAVVVLTQDGAHYIKVVDLGVHKTLVFKYLFYLDKIRSLQSRALPKL